MANMQKGIYIYILSIDYILLVTCNNSENQMYIYNMRKPYLSILTYIKIATLTMQCFIKDWSFSFSLSKLIFAKIGGRKPIGDSMEVYPREMEPHVWFEQTLLILSCTITLMGKESSKWRNAPLIRRLMKDSSFPVWIVWRNMYSPKS